MGFFEVIAETSRRAITGDNWYVAEGTYVLELRATGLAASDPINGLGSISRYVVLPLGPQGYTVRRVMRQGITPTMGGLVAEERGLLWREITVRGTFGLLPKETFDTSITPDAPPGLFNLSGPGWTRRIVRNYFEKYASMKANVDLAPYVQMIWHDLKTDEHWVVVPEFVEIDRNVQARHQYPYVMQFKGIANASDLLAPPAPASLKGFGKLKQILAAINKALALVASAIQELSAIVGEIAYFAATIDSIIDKLTTISNAAQDFIDGVTDLFSIGRDFLISTQQLMDSLLLDMENATDLPSSVRNTMLTAADGVDAMAAQRAAFGTSYDSVAASIAESESGARRTPSDDLDAAEAAGPATSVAELDSQTVRSSDNDLIKAGVFDTGRAFGNYAGFRTYVIRRMDTLQSIAAQVIGDGTLWYDIAIVNGLSSPYITPTGAPGTVKPGDIISVPVLAGDGENARVDAGEGSEPGVNLLGTDLKLRETGYGLPGRPQVDLQIDKRTYRDCAAITGVENLKQAIQLRTWTIQGTMPLIPAYGLPRIIGVNAVGAEIQLLELAMRQTLQSDSRVKQITSVRTTAEQDRIEFDIDVVPVGSNTAQAVSTSVT